MTYVEKLQDPRWQKKRLEILERDRWTCRLCNDTKTTLHIHHIKYSKEPWDAENKDLVCYCKHCHSIIEFNKKHNIAPISVAKSELVSGVIQLHLSYVDDDFLLYVDVYHYKNDKLTYVCSISAQIFSELEQWMLGKLEAP